MLERMGQRDLKTMRFHQQRGEKDFSQTKSEISAAFSF